MKPLLSRTRILNLALCAFVLSTQYSFADKGGWVGSWGAAPAALPLPSGSQTLAATTYRNVIHTSVGGLALRVTLTNELGTDPLTISEATVATSSGGGAVRQGSVAGLTFGGKSSVTIAPGSVAVSDPVAASVHSFSDLAVSVSVPQQKARVITRHGIARASSYQAAGAQAAAVTLTASVATTSWYFLKSVEVFEPRAATIVALGDSITDGFDSTIDANHRWTDALALRVSSSFGGKPLGILNEGISGNRLLLGSSSGGVDAVDRLSRDVLSQSGAKYLIILEGFNDIRKGSPLPASASEVTGALSQIANRAHNAGLKVFGATLTPSSILSASSEQVRESVNSWIRTSGVFDGVIDFDRVTRDPAHPTAFLPKYDSGDHIHPSDAGYAAMGNSINLNLFR